MTTIQQTSANETSDKGAPVPTEAALRRISLLTLAVAWFVFQIWIVSSPLPPLVERPIHLVLALAVVFLSKPLFRTGGASWLRIADILAVLTVAGLAGFYLLNSGRLGSRMEDVDPIFTQDIIFGGLLVLILLEGVRRTVGWSLLGVILAFLFYATLGPWLPGMAGFSGFRVDQLTEILTMSGNGIWGITTETSVQFVFYFVAFGAFYGAAGGGQLLIDLGLKLSGRQKGGAAKAAVVSSSLMGSISGSAVANVAATGVFTIPLMRQSGYSREAAAAVEAIASTGGQLMPPVMGVAAFLMAELLQREYWEIAVAGLIPALAFYFSVFFLVDLEARKRGEESLGTADGKSAAAIAPRLHLLLPPLVLVGSLTVGYSATSAAVYGIVTCVVAAALRKSTRSGFRHWLNTIDETAKMAGQVALPIAAIGIIIAVAIQSNLALKFSTLLIVGGSGPAIESMLLIVVGCLIMGMGLPTVAAYIIGAILFVPALRQLGIPDLTAHFFVMYYCVLSMVTPPVALASYTAAGLAGANTLKASMLAFRMSFVCFLIPFAFAFDSHLLGQDPGWWTVAAILSLGVATALWAASLAGYLRRLLTMWERIVAAALSIGVILSPTGSTPWIFGFVTLLAFTTFLLMYGKRREVAL